MKRIVAFGILVSGVVFLGQGLAADKTSEAKEGLQELNEFIGGWKGSGGPDKPKLDPKDPTWSEEISWGWRFKKDDIFLYMEVKDGKHFKNGELRYLADKKVYQLTATDSKDEKRVFEGKLAKGYLTLDRVDPRTKQAQRITMNSAGDGVRFIYAYSYKPEGTTIYVRDYKVSSSKIGESLGGAAKKAECVVTGGLGTMTVSHKGVTYYVCCSGCRDAFNDEPDKIIKEYEARKKKKK